MRCYGWSERSPAVGVALVLCAERVRVAQSRGSVIGDSRRAVVLGGLTRFFKRVRSLASLESGTLDPIL